MAISLSSGSDVDGTTATTIKTEPENFNHRVAIETASTSGTFNIKWKLGGAEGVAGVVSVPVQDQFSWDGSAEELTIEPSGLDGGSTYNFGYSRK